MLLPQSLTWRGDRPGDCPVHDECAVDGTGPILWTNTSHRWILNRSASAAVEDPPMGSLMLRIHRWGRMGGC